MQAYLGFSSAFLIGIYLFLDVHRSFEQLYSMRCMLFQSLVDNFIYHVGFEDIAYIGEYTTYITFILYMRCKAYLLCNKY